MNAMPTRDSEITSPIPDYDPLILQSNFRTTLSAVLDSLDSVRKCCFLQNLSDSFKKILSCNECESILQENSTAYRCGHSFCDKCDVKKQTCVKCRIEGYDAAVQIRNYSKLLEIIDTMSHNFNSESVISEMIKFMVTPVEILKSKENKPRFTLPITTPRNPATNKKSTESSIRKSRNSTTGKNSKRRLQYDEENEETPVKCSNDSDYVFVNSRKKAAENHSESYLQNQTSIADASLAVDTKKIKEIAPKSGSKRKRLEDRESETPAKSDIVSRVVQKLLDTKKRKFNKTEDDSENNNCNRRSSRRSLTKRNFDATIDDDKVVDKESENIVESQFVGFETCDVESRYNELKTTLNYYKKNVEAASENAKLANENGRIDSNDVGVTCADERAKTNEQRTGDSDNGGRTSINGNVKAKITDTVASKQNNNIRLSLPVTEEEEQIDVNVWEKNEQVQRKKKLFKSVKERKKRTLLVERMKDLKSLSESPAMKEPTQPKLSPKCREQDGIGENARKPVTESDGSETTEKTCEVERGTTANVRVLLPKLDEASFSMKTTNGNIVDDNSEMEINSPSLLAPEDLPKLCDEKSKEPISVDANDNQTSLLLCTSEETPILVDSVSDYKISQNCENAPAKRAENEIRIPMADSVSSQEICIVSDKGTNDEITRNEPSSSVIEIISVADTSSSNIYSINDSVVSDATNVSEVRPKERIMSSTNGKSVSLTNGNRETFDTDKNARDSPSKRTAAAGIDAERRAKCENLRKTINDQNQKLLSNVIKSFSVKSPTALHIEKCKRGKSISPKKTPEITKPDGNFDEASARQTKYSTPNGNRTESDVASITPTRCDHNDSSTICNSPAVRSVHCQTTSDLHLSLLMQEFPHFFAKPGLPSSIYDTPTDTTGGAETNGYEGVKTPASSRQRAAKLMTVSSITSSEKKLCDREFERDDSVVGPTFSTPMEVESMDESYISRLPSTGKKMTEDSAEMRKLNVRLNFGLCDNATNSVGERVGVANDSVEVLDSVAGNDDEACNIANASSNVQESQEVLFNTNDRVENEEERIPPNDGIESISKILTEKEDVTKKHRCDDDNVSILDENDVDFVAGTPPSYSKKLAENRATENYVDCGGETPDSHVSDKSASSQCLISSLPSIFYDVENTPNNRPSIERRKDDTKSTVASSQTNYFVTTSGLHEADLALVNAFCRKFGATLTGQLVDETTHVVVKTTDENRANRTFKYLQAIVHSLTIVTLRWVQECVRRGIIVDADEYLPLDSSGECGPLRAFNYRKGLTPSPLAWLRDFCIHFAPPIPKACTLTQLQELMTKAGAKVVDTLKDFKKYPNLHHVIVVEYDEEDPPLSNSDVANGLQIYQAITIEFDWVLETIGRNRLVPFAEYELVEIPQDILQQYNFPPEMLRYENTEDFE